MRHQAKLDILEHNKKQFDHNLAQLMENNRRQITRDLEERKSNIIRSYSQIINDLKNNYQYNINATEQRLKSQIIEEYEKRKLLIRQRFQDRVAFQERNSRIMKEAFVRLQEEKQNTFNELSNIRERLLNLIIAKTKAKKVVDGDATNLHKNLEYQRSRQQASIFNWNKNADRVNKKRRQLYGRWETTFLRYKNTLLSWKKKKVEFVK